MAFKLWPMIGFGLLPLPGSAFDLTLSVQADERPDSPLVVLVYGEQLPAMPDRNWQVDQIDKTFIPEVLVVPVNEKVSFPNKDNIRHHVYSFSKGNEFELPLYKGTPAEPIQFASLGEVTLGCNIHDWMRGYVLVTDAPYWQYMDKDKLNISHLAAGTYRVQLWHPALARAVEQTVELLGDVEISFAAEFKTLIQPKRKRFNQRGRGY